MRALKPMIEIDSFKGQGEVSSISFSNKGLYFAAAWKNSSSCRVFNLRKMKEESLEVPDADGFKTSFVSFDYYGNYLATGAGTAVSLYTGKLFNEPVKRFSQNDGNVNVVRFAPSGSYFASGADDRWLKVHSV